VKNAHRIQLQEILESLATRTGSLNPYEFEKLILLVLKQLEGVSFGKVTQRSRDGGVDGYVSKDAIGRKRVPFQAKRTTATIGAPQVQQFSGAMLDMRAQCGFFVTTSRFSPDAHRCELVRKGVLTLIDWPSLLDWMYQFEIGVIVESSIRLKILSPHGFRLDE
jgi:restriction system protein